MYADQTQKIIRRLNNLGSYQTLKVDYILDILFKYICVKQSKNIILKFILNTFFTCNKIKCFT